MITSQLGVTEWKIYCGYIRRKASCFVFSHLEHRNPSKKGGYRCHTTGWRKISWKKVVCSRHSKVNDLKRTLAGKIHVLFCNQELLFRVQQYIKMGKDKNIFCVSHWSFFYFVIQTPGLRMSPSWSPYFVYSDVSTEDSFSPVWILDVDHSFCIKGKVWKVSRALIISFHRQHVHIIICVQTRKKICLNS